MRNYRYDIHNNLPHGALKWISEQTGCNASTITKVFNGKKDIHGIIERSELLAAINLWQQRFCRKESKLDAREILFRTFPYIGNAKKITNEIFKSEILNKDVLVESLYKNSIPPIEGEISVRKLVWRGIRLITVDDMVWLDQRGKKISPILTY